MPALLPLFDSARRHLLATARTTVHYLVFDLFVGRWIYWQGQESGVFTRHSLALCLFAGPIGLRSHLLTQALWQRFSKPEPLPQAQPKPPRLNSQRWGEPPGSWGSWGYSRGAVVRSQLPPKPLTMVQVLATSIA